MLVETMYRIQNTLLGTLPEITVSTRTQKSHESNIITNKGNKQITKTKSSQPVAKLIADVAKQDPNTGEVQRNADFDRARQNKRHLSG